MPQGLLLDVWILSILLSTWKLSKHFQENTTRDHSAPQAQLALFGLHNVPACNSSNCCSVLIMLSQQQTKLYWEPVSFSLILSYWQLGTWLKKKDFLPKSKKEKKQLEVCHILLYGYILNKVFQTCGTLLSHTTEDPSFSSSQDISSWNILKLHRSVSKVQFQLLTILWIKARYYWIRILISLWEFTQIYHRFWLSKNLSKTPVGHVVLNNPRAQMYVGPIFNIWKDLRYWFSLLLLFILIVLLYFSY